MLCEMLTTVVAKIIHVTVELSPTWTYWLLLLYSCAWIWSDTQTVEQCVFLHESYVMWNCYIVTECQRKLCENSPMITVPSTTGISKLINEVKYTGSQMDNKGAKKCWQIKKMVLTEFFKAPKAISNIAINEKIHYWHRNQSPTTHSIVKLYTTVLLHVTWQPVCVRDM